MPGYQIAYLCSGCEMNGSVYPGATSFFEDDLVIAYDPDKEKLTTLKRTDATDRNLEILEDPYIEGDNSQRLVSGRDENGVDIGANSPATCPRCGGTISFGFLGFWD